jgi:hypothetical protein
MTNHAVNGRAREYRVRDAMKKHGWRCVMRASGSKGSADLAMVHPERGMALIQVGTAASKRLGPAARRRFLADAHDSGSLPILATVIPGVGIRYQEVIDGPASTWHEWSPA